MRLRRTQAFVFTATFVTIGMMTGCSSAISGTSSTPAPETASPTVSVDPRVAALCTEFDAALQATYLNPTFRATANARKVPAQIKTVLRRIRRPSHPRSSNNPRAGNTDRHHANSLSRRT